MKFLCSFQGQEEKSIKTTVFWTNLKQEMSQHSHAKLKWRMSLSHGIYMRRLVV